MQIKRFIERWENSLRENTFLKVLILLLVGALMVNGQFFKRDRMIIVPPYLTRPFTVTEKGVSPEYTEQLAVFLAAFATSFTPSNITYNITTLLKYVDPSAYSTVRTALLAQKTKVETQGLIQSFYPEKAVCYEKNNTVDIIGRSIRYNQNVKIFDGREAYRITFVYDPHAGLRVTGFRPLDESETVKTLQGQIIEAPTPYTQP